MFSYIEESVNIPISEWRNKNFRQSEQVKKKKSKLGIANKNSSVTYYIMYLHLLFPCGVCWADYLIRTSMWINYLSGLSTYLCWTSYD